MGRATASPGPGAHSPQLEPAMPPRLEKLTAGSGRLEVTTVHVQSIRQLQAAYPFQVFFLRPFMHRTPPRSILDTE